MPEYKTIVCDNDDYDIQKYTLLEGEHGWRVGTIRTDHRDPKRAAIEFVRDDK